MPRRWTRAPSAHFRCKLRVNDISAGREHPKPKLFQDIGHVGDVFPTWGRRGPRPPPPKPGLDPRQARPSLRRGEVVAPSAPAIGAVLGRVRILRGPSPQRGPRDGEGRLRPRERLVCGGGARARARMRTDVSMRPLVTGSLCLWPPSSCAALHLGSAYPCFGLQA